MKYGIAITPAGEVTAFELGERNYETIVRHVGGIITSVRTSDETVVAYVHDEGLLIGLEPNVFASVFTGQNIVGPMVVVGAVSEQGEYDGEDHDVPEFYKSKDFAELVNRLNNDEKSKDVISANIDNMDFSMKFIPMNDEQFNEWMKDGTLPVDEVK
jgi:Domain of unknown function (DUF3846)